MSENEQQITDTTGNGSGTGSGTAAGQEPKEVKKRSRRTFEVQFSVIRNAIELSLTDETLKQVAAEYGYPAERIQKLKEMFDETETCYEAQKTARSKQRAATRKFEGLKTQATGIIRHLVDTAQLAFKNAPDTYDELGLREPREKAFGPWVAQSKYFFSKLLIPANVAEMANYKVTQEYIEAGNQALLDTIKAETEGENAKAEAQKATELKNRAWRKLRGAMRRYLNIMKEALADDPQMKEKLGIVVPYEG